MNPVKRFYEGTVLPLCTDLVTWQANKLRRRVLEGVSGRVLEVGIGTAPSLKFYGPDVAEVVGIEPEPAYRAIRRRMHKTGFDRLTVRSGSALDLPFEDESFDAVSFQLVLCTVPSPDKCLAEAHRVLRPGGQLIYVEHVRHDQPEVAAFQDRWNDLWGRCAGGCRLNQDTAALIKAAGFQTVWADGSSGEMRPRFLSQLIWGVSAKPVD